MSTFTVSAILGDICDLQDDAVVSVVIAVDTELDLA